jgi:cytochrome c553
MPSFIYGEISFQKLLQTTYRKINCYPVSSIKTFFKTVILANTNMHMPRYLFIPFFLLTAVLVQAQQKPATALPEKGKALAKPCMNCHASPGAALADPLNGIRKIRTAGYIYSQLKNPMVFADENKTAKKGFCKKRIAYAAVSHSIQRRYKSDTGLF